MRRSSSAWPATCRWWATSSPGGKSSLIVYRNGMWYIDTNRDGVTDSVVPLRGGARRHSADGELLRVRASWTTSSSTGPAIWYVDTDLSGSANLTYMFGGVPGDMPLAGDVNGDGMADLAIYRNGIWYIDTNRNGTADMTVVFGGMPQDIPLLFDWNGDGKADLCLFRDGIVVREHEARRRGGRDLRLRRRRRPAHARQVPLTGRSRAAPGLPCPAHLPRSRGSDGSRVLGN